jgi:ABC-type bacteriocin/lantibiotic exporter with double-glycine peptidase domain
VIAHRQETIDNADRVIRIEKGRIIARVNAAGGGSDAPVPKGMEA